MNEEHKKIIIKAIADQFALKEKYSDYQLNSNFQLLLVQLDLFKTISTLVVAIIGIGYFLNNHVNTSFFIISFVFSLITILGTISYTREIIDLEFKQINKQGIALNKKIDEIINLCVEAIKKEDSKIFFDYAEQEVKSKYLKDRLVYAGEIFSFCFYNSIAFGLLAFFADKYNFSLLSYVTILTVIFVSFVSFKDWVRYIVDFLSKEIKIIRRSNIN
jgi:hypothetical protein